MKLNGTTKLSFSRYLDTGDSRDVTLNDTTIYVLYAFAPTDGDSNNNYVQHTVRGVGAINFMSGNATATNQTVPNNVTVISVNSTGNCMFSIVSNLIWF